MQRKELIEKRTANKKFYENQDHSVTAEIYLDSVHYQDDDGSWKEMNDSLLEEAPEPEDILEEDSGDENHSPQKDLVNHKGDWSVRLKKMSNPHGNITMKKKEKSITWGIEGCRKVKCEQKDGTVSYTEILKGVDLRCKVKGTRVKENLVLKEPEAASSFVYLYRMKKLTAVWKGKRVAFLDEQGEEVFSVNAPYMEDAAGTRTDAIQITLEENKENQAKVIFTPDKEWLMDPERQYPVVIDPLTTTSKKVTEIEDTIVSSLYEEDIKYQDMWLRIIGGDQICRSFLKFTLPEIKTGDMVVGARLVLASLADDGAKRTVQVHKVLQTWESKNLNWYNKPVYEETIQDSCTYTGDQQKYITLDITRMVKDWYQNGGNYGLMLKDPYELSGTTLFLSSDCSEEYQDMRPHIEISYVNYSGIEDYWSYHTQDIGRAGTAYVNDYNGNLILSHNTLTMGGSLMPVSLSHVYNTNNCKENLGYGNGFRLSYHQTIEKVSIGGTDYYKHVDGDGTVHYFDYDSDKEQWKDESDPDLVLLVTAGGTEPYVIRDKEENCLVFGSSGYLVKLRDKNGNELTVNYANKRITKLTDGAGRVTKLSYTTDSNGKAADLIKVTFPSGQTKQFSYAGGNLVTITDVDGEILSYEYNSANLLTRAVSADGYAVRYAYYTTQPYRIKSITEYAGNVKGNSLTFTYGYNSTKVTDSKGRSEISRFDNNGNVIHIHDGFGHAVSGKYSRESNYLHRLENSTKLQENVVQLLKDPIIQAKTLGWKSKIYPADAGTASVNPNISNCKVGDRSLEASCSSLTGYVYWGQSVKLKKGKTYTGSIYVKAAIEKAAEDGGVFLRIAYRDKENKSQLLHSEILKSTVPDFVQLIRTFTLPEDAYTDTVNFYVSIYHAIGTIYADMAQLEAGDTPNRCNLVDNGEFHLGTTDGFSKTGEIYDELVTIGSSVSVPMQVALMVTAASATLRKSPSDTAEAVATVTKHTHLSGEIRFSYEGKTWYRARTASGQKGYILSSQAIVYLGGSEGVNTAAVGVSNAILRASASDTGTPVQEAIPKWTSVAISNTKVVSNKKWYYVGMQIDTNRYFGYLKEEQVVSLCRNAATGTTNGQTKLYSTMSASGTSVGTIDPQKTIRLRGTATDASGKKWYVVRRNKDFLYVQASDITPVKAPVIERIKSTSLKNGVGGLSDSVYKFTGDPAANKKLTKVLDISGKAGDTYMINAWGCGSSLPETDNDKARRFGVEVIFVGADGKNDVHYTNFSPDILDWQFLSDVYVAKQAYDSIKISYTYCHNGNTAYFDGLSLYREEYGQSYTYDKDNNLVSVVNSQKQNSKFEYNSNQDMTGIVDAKGNKFTYEYDKKHNVTKGTSAQGIVYTFGYDAKGNVIKSGCADPANLSVGVWLARTMTGNKNQIASATDAKGNKVQYFWDQNRDLMLYMLDGKGNKISYTYDDVDRLSGISQEMTVDGRAKTLKETYTYTDDRLTSINHNGFSYGFAYDGFGNTTSASVAGKQVVGYTYEANNGNLQKVTYGNGDYIRYTYDDQDRLLLSYYKSTAAGAEVKLHEYVYDKSGNLYQVTAHMAGKVYRLSYDLLDRLMRVTDEQGNSYTYTYDKNNCMEKMNHTCGSSSANTSYTYDKDSREVTTKCAASYIRTSAYDKFGRVTKYSWNTQKAFNTVYTYFDSGNNRSNMIKTLTNGTETMEYTYDANGNITSIKDAAGESSFRYDELNRLIRENNHVLKKTVTYRYDLGGNMTAVNEYAFTAADDDPAQPIKTETGIYSTVWKDQLLSWDGVSMTYDAIGNMLTKGSTSYTWTQGRKLAGVENGKSIQYFYDHTGARTKKVVDGIKTEYRMAGDLLVSEKTGTQTYWYRYDSGANLVSVTIAGKIYFYVRNAQNDVIGLIDANGNTVVKYAYDSWGKLLEITGDLKDTIGVQNPFRYRGYYYDNETGMYYLRSRYYDPALRRLISSDEMPTVQMSIDSFHNRNLYAYCNENPIMRFDGKGYIWGIALLGAVVGAAAGALVSIDTQVVFEKKSMSEIDWVEVGTSAISGAVATTSIGKAGQIVINAALGGAGSIIKGEDLGAVVFNTAVGGISGRIGGAGAGFAKERAEYVAKKGSYEVGKFMAIPMRDIERELYARSTRRKLLETPVRGILGYGNGKISPKVRDNSKAKSYKSLIVNYDQNRGYVPCHPQITNHPLYA